MRARGRGGVGLGGDAKPNQKLTATDVGPDEDDVVRPVEDLDDGVEYPDPSEFIELTVEPQ